MPAGASPLQRGDGLLEPHRTRRETAGEGEHQLLHAILEGDEEGPARPAGFRGRRGRPARGAAQGEDHAAVLPLHLEETRHGGRERERVGIRGVDAADERLRHALQRLAPQASAHEGAQALVGVSPARQDEIHGHPELAAPGEERRAEQGSQPGGGQELEAVGQRMEAAVEGHEGGAEAIVGADEAVLEADPAAERQRPGLLGDEGVGPGFHEEAVTSLGLHDAAEPVTRLEQRQGDPLSALARALHRPMGRRQPGDAAADDDESHGEAGQRADISWTMSTRART